MSQNLKKKFLLALIFSLKQNEAFFAKYIILNIKKKITNSLYETNKTFSFPVAYQFFIFYQTFSVTPTYKIVNIFWEKDPKLYEHRFGF